LSAAKKEELADFAQWILRIGDGQLSEISISQDEQASFIKIQREALLMPFILICFVDVIILCI
jgi:hypothetical protein